MKEYEFHPVANVFPLIEGPEFEALVQDIRENGLREPIWLYEGRILDGRNRYRACREAGVEPRCEVWDGNGDLLKFVVSMNLHRRQLSESQRAMVAAKMKSFFEKEAKQRQGTRSDISANLRGSEKKKSSEDAAKTVNVSSRSIDSANKVLKRGTPELIAQVESGHIRVSAAAKIADKSEKEQARLLSLPKKERSKELNSGQLGTREPKAPQQQEVAEVRLDAVAHTDIAGELEVAIAAVFAAIEKAKADNWSELPKATIIEHLQNLNVAVSGAEDVVSQIDVSLLTDAETIEIPRQPREDVTEATPILSERSDPETEIESSENPTFVSIDDLKTKPETKIEPSENPIFVSIDDLKTKLSEEHHALKTAVDA